LIFVWAEDYEATVDATATPALPFPFGGLYGSWRPWPVEREVTFAAEHPGNSCMLNQVEVTVKRTFDKEICVEQDGSLGFAR
jgi:hypothetical protein